MRQIFLLPFNQLDPTPHLAGRRVLTPNRRAARGVNAPPESLESLARKCLRGSPFSLAPKLACHRLMIDLARADGPADDPEGLARRVTPVIRTFLRAGLDLDRLVAEASPRVAKLGTLSRAYRNRLRALGQIDPAESLRIAAGLPPMTQPILVTGYPRLGLDERFFIDAVAGDNSIVLLPYLDHPSFADNAEVAEFFRMRGWVVENSPLGPVDRAECFCAPAAQQAYWAYIDQDAEVRGALGRIKELLLDGVSADEIALVARNDAAYGPLALEIAWEYGLPLRALYAVPLTETRFGAWVKQLLDAINSDLAFEPTFRMLAHPLSPTLPLEKRNQARTHHPASASEWREQAFEIDSLAWPEADTREQWRLTFVRILKAMEVRKQAARWPQASLAYRALVDALPILLTPPGEIISREAFARELLEVLGLLTVPAQPGRGGVELHTPLSIYGARYRHVIVMGVAENIMPAPVSNSPVLDFHDRKELSKLHFRLEDAAGAARREFLSFASLLQTATESLTLSYPRLIDARAALPSVYFKFMGATPQPATIEAVYSPEEARRIWTAREETISDPLLVFIAAALKVERRRESHEAPDAHDGVIGLPLDPDARRFSPSQLTVIGQCPFKWFVQYALRLAVPAEPEDDLQPNTRGSLYHKALELAVEAAREETDIRAGVLRRLEWALRQAEADPQVKLPKLTAWESRREEHVRTLTRAVLGAEFILPDAQVMHLEKEFDTQWRGLHVGGVVDRIDDTPGGLVLIDYKTSGSAPKGARDEHGKANLDLQLPIYIEAAAPLLCPDRPVAKAIYYSLTKGKVLKEAKHEEAQLAAFAQGVQAHLRDGSYPVRPDVARAACTYCDFEIACRFGPRVARKEQPLCP